MWIFTDTGFISIVRKPERPDSLTVRARDRKSLEALATLASAEIKRSPHGDYPYRVFVGDAEFNQWLLSRTAELDYSNFKNQVAKTRGSKFAHLLHDVWAAMLGAEDDESTHSGARRERQRARSHRRHPAANGQGSCDQLR